MHDGEEVIEEMNRGCPEGSVLSPTLWNLTFDILLNKPFPNTARPIAFADDVAFVIQGNLRRDLEVTGRIV